MTIVACLGLFVCAFLLGSIPWGVVISTVFYHTDVRDHGSGNIGTTNAMRTMGKVGGSAVFVLDFAKGLASGALAVAAQQLFFADAVSGTTAISHSELVCIAFFGCILGHIFCPWLGFKGGKGIAVAVGCLFVTFGPVGAFIEIALFAVLVIATRYVSVGSIAAAVLCPFLSAYYFLYSDFAPIGFVLCCIAVCVVIWAHRENIRRLRTGSENRIGSKNKG